MLNLNASEKFEHWADAHLTSPSPEEIFIAIEELGLDYNCNQDPEDIDYYIELLELRY